MNAANIMTTSVVTLSADGTMYDAMRIISAKRVRQIPVVDASGKVAGVITPRSLMKAILPKYIVDGLLPDVRFAPELPQFLQNIDGLTSKAVKDFIDRDFVRVTPETSTMEVATLFIHAEKNIESILVVDDGGRLLGIISPWDIFKRLWEYSGKKEEK